MDQPHQGNSCIADPDEETIPCKKRRLTGESHHADSFSNDTQEFVPEDDSQENALQAKGDPTSNSNRNELHNSEGGDHSIRKGALNLLDDIFEDMTTKENLGSIESHKRNSLPAEIKVFKDGDFQIKNDFVSKVNGLAKNNENKIGVPPNCGKDHDLTRDDSNLVHNSSFTSGTQEYLMSSDSLDFSQNTADISYIDNAVSNDEHGADIVKNNHEQNLIVLDDSFQDNAEPQFISEHSSKEGIDSADERCIKKIPSLVRDATIISSIVPSVNYNIIYNKLLENRNDGNRLDFVTASLLESTSVTATTSTSKKALPNPTRSIIEDVELLVKQFPVADADLVYAFLESIKNESDRVDKTIKEMGLNKEREKTPMLKKISTLLDDPVLASDPLFSDMRIVAKVFPDRDRNEIYALLEANVDKSNRIQIVINELLHGMPRNETDNTTNKSSTDYITAAPIEPIANIAFGDDAPAVTDLTDIPNILPEQEDIEHLLLLFPDCDPNYLFERIEGMKDVIDKRMALAAELSEKGNYPKLRDRLEKENLEEGKAKRIKRDFTVEEFLNKFPDPQTTFGDPTKPLSDAYKAHARASILNDYLLFKTDYLTKTLEEHNFHYYLTSKKVFDVLVRTPVAERRLHRRFMKSRRKKLMPVPTENDEYFFHEYWFTHNELNIEDYKKQKEAERLSKVEDAREKGELYECCCCFEDECLFEDLANCPEGHLFCKDCVVRSTEAAFGEMKNRFPCLTGECDQDIPLSTLQGIIPPNLFSKIVSRLQEEEVLQAQIPDLVTCPFCPFATIMPDQDDKVLKCLNPECLKQSCRLCREESHIPLKCNEVECRAGTRMRTYIENKVAEAVMRKCHKCGKSFLKDSGCNKMTCVCGASSCYFCKKPGIDYSHFEKNKQCGQTDPKVIHDRDMKEAAKKAMEDYILEHPEAADLDLQSDLSDLIANSKPKKPAQKEKNKKVRYTNYGADTIKFTFDEPAYGDEAKPSLNEDDMEESDDEY